MHTSPDLARRPAMAAQSQASPADLLMQNFLIWLDAAPRDYGAVMEGWRSSCPRLSIWEDALAEGLVRIEPVSGAMATTRVALTAAGRARLG